MAFGLTSATAGFYLAANTWTQVFLAGTGTGSANLIIQVTLNLCNVINDGNPIYATIARTPTGITTSGAIDATLHIVENLRPIYPYPSQEFARLVYTGERLWVKADRAGLIVQPSGIPSFMPPA